MKLTISIIPLSQKLSTITFFFLLSLSFGVRCQESVLKYNLESKAFVNYDQFIESLKKGGKYRIQVESINRNNQRLVLNIKDSSNSKPLALPVFENLSIDIIKSVMAGVSDLAVKVTDFKSKLDENHAFLEKASGVGSSYKLLGNPYVDEPIRLSLLDISRADAIKESIFALVNELNSFEEQIRNYTEFVEEIELNAIKYELNRTLKSKDAIEFNHFSIENYYTNLLFQFELKRKEIRDERDKLLDIKNNYFKYRIDNFEELTTNKTLKNLDSSFTKSLVAVDSTFIKALNNLSYSKAKDYITQLSKLYSRNENTVTSPQYTFNGNATTIKLYVKKNDLTRTDVEEDSLLVKIPKISKSYFLTGLGYYYSGLRDDIYSEVKTVTIAGKDTSTSYSYNKENAGGEMGIASFLKFGNKIYKDHVGLHASLGVGVSISPKIRPRMLLGVGASFGRTNMISIDFGMIAGYVERVSNSFDTSKVYSAQNSSFLYSKLASNTFVSIGYLFSL